MGYPKKKTGLGFRLPGMIAIDDTVSSGIGLSEKLSGLLEFTTASIIKVKVSKAVIDGESIDVEESVKAETKLNQIRNVAPVKLGGLFVAFGFIDEGESEKKCLLVSFVPETMPVRSKMFLASSKGKVKRGIASKNPDVLIEEYNCSELKEISEEVYIKKKSVAKPFSEAEKARMEWDKADKGGGESFLAKMMQAENKNAFALPGFGLGMKPSEVKKNRVASMAVARSKDEERNNRVNFLLKLKQEKEKMEKEKEMLEQGKKNDEKKEGDGEEEGEDNEKSSNEPMEAEKPVTETIDLNVVEEADSSDEE